MWYRAFLFGEKNLPVFRDLASSGVGFNLSWDGWDSRLVLLRSGALRWVAIVGVCASIACSREEPESSRALALGFMVFDEDVAQAQSDTARLLVALQQINEQGGIELEGEAYKLDLVTANHKGTPEGAVAAIHEFAEQDVVAVIGPPWSTLTLGDSGDGSDGAVGAAREDGILLVSGSATAPQISGVEDDELMWRTVPSDAFQAEVTASVLVDDERVSSASMLFRDDAWGQGLSGSFRTAFEELGGTVLESIGYDVSEADLDALSSRDFTDELDLVFEGSPEAVYLLNFDEFLSIAAQIVSGGYLEAYPANRPLIYVSDSVFDENTLVNVGPKVLSRLRGTSQIPEEGNANFGRFAETIEGEGLGTPEIYDAARHDAAFLVALAIQKAGSLDVNAVKSELRGISHRDDGDVEIGYGEWAKAKAAMLDGQGLNYEGPSGAIEFSAQGDATSGTYVIWSVVDADTDPSFDFAKTVTYSAE